MAKLYDKPVRVLMKEMIPALGIEKNQIFTRSEVRDWFKTKYPLIKDGTISAHLLRLSVNAPSRVYYSAKRDQDDVFYQVDSSRFRIYNPSEDPAPIYEKIETQPEDYQEQHTDLTDEFAYEKDLQNYLAKNLHQIELGLTLYEEDEINGIEFPVGGRFVDILALDQNNDLVVIELKVSKGYDRVVGQLLRYVAWIKKNHADPEQSVRGFIIARSITSDLMLACSEVSGIQLFEYEMSVNLREVKA